MAVSPTGGGSPTLALAQQLSLEHFGQRPDLGDPAYLRIVGPLIEEYNRIHRVALTAETLAVLWDWRRLDGAEPAALVFPSQQAAPLSDTSLSAVLKHMGVAVTVHGFRSTSEIGRRRERILRHGWRSRPWFTASPTALKRPIDGATF